MLAIIAWCLLNHPGISHSFKSASICYLLLCKILPPNLAPQNNGKHLLFHTVMRLRNSGEACVILAQASHEVAV